MEEIKDFETFYDVKIVPILPQLKKLNKAAGSLGMGIVITGLLTVASFIATISKMWNKEAGITITILLLIATIIFSYKYIRTENRYTKAFKQKVIKTIIEYLKADIIYEPDNYVSEKEYKRSGLFRKWYDYYEGDDLLKGRYKSTDFYCSELHTCYEVHERKRHYDVRIFKGLFFVAAVKQNLTGGTYVWPADNDQQMKSMERNHWMRPITGAKKLQLDDSLFESYFCAYSSNEQEAIKILTAEMRGLLVKFLLQLKRKISFSVVNGQCYVSIPIKEDLFEPSTNPSDKEEIKKHFFTVLLVFSIINQLELSKLN